MPKNLTVYKSSYWRKSLAENSKYFFIRSRIYSSWNERGPTIEAPLQGVFYFTGTAASSSRYS